jgi:enoyl-CoA hydratase
MRRPHSNAMSEDFLLDLASAIRRLEAEPEIRAIVLASAYEGVFFSVGLDFGVMTAFDLDGPGARDRIVETFGRMGACFEAVATCRKPVVAAIYGHALGGGCELALCCDYRVMVEDGRSRIGLNEIGLALMPAVGSTQRLPRLIGVARALPLLYEGTRLGARDAEQIGLVRSVTPEGFRSAVDELASRLAGAPTAVLGLIKDAVHSGLDLPLEEGMRLERDHFARACLGEDVRIGVTSFLSGKEPRFTGR